MVDVRAERNQSLYASGGHFSTSTTCAPNSRIAVETIPPSSIGGGWLSAGSPGFHDSLKMQRSPSFPPQTSSKALIAISPFCPGEDRYRNQ